MGRKKRDDELSAFRARFAPREQPIVRVRQGTGRPRKKSASPPPAPAPSPSLSPCGARADLARWESLPDHATPEIPFEPRPRGRVIARDASAVASEIACDVCGRRFDPDAPEHKKHGRRDRCGPCGRGEDPPRLVGEMEWYHKSVPVLRIAGRPDLSPEEKAKLRRR